MFSVQPTLELHPHQEFHFADDTDSHGCCCCWRSRSKKPKEYYVNRKDELTPMRNTTSKVEARIRANRRLAELVKSKFQDTPIEDNLLFDKLRERINYNFENERITEDRLIEIIQAIRDIKSEISVGEKSESHDAITIGMSIEVNSNDGEVHCSEQ